MRGFIAIAAAGAVLGAVAVSSTASHAATGSNAMGSNKATATNPHRRDVAQRHHRHRHAARPAPGYTTREGGAAPGCYRWGETGYHWYPFCLGPSFLYPHQRVCRGGYCWYYQ